MFNKVTLTILLCSALNANQACYSWNWPWNNNSTVATTLKSVRLPWSTKEAPVVPEVPVVKEKDQPLASEDSCPEFTLNDDEETIIDEVLNNNDNNQPEKKPTSSIRFNAKRAIFVSGIGALALATLYAAHLNEPAPWEATKKDLTSPFSWISQQLQKEHFTEKSKGILGVLTLGCCAELLASYLFEYQSYVGVALRNIKSYLP